MAQNFDPAVRRYARKIPRLAPKTRAVHMTRREGDEMACSCGARWENGEAHP